MTATTVQEKIGIGITGIIEYDSATKSGFVKLWDEEEQTWIVSLLDHELENLYRLYQKAKENVGVALL
jgi:hypothetical protein